jgi:hypothetical protein
MYGVNGMSEEFRCGLYSEDRYKHDWHLYDALTPMMESADSLMKSVKDFSDVPMAVVTKEAYEQARQKMDEAWVAIWWLLRVCDQHAG